MPLDPRLRYPYSRPYAFATTPGRPSMYGQSGESASKYQLSRIPRGIHRCRYRNPVSWYACIDGRGSVGAASSAASAVGGAGTGAGGGGAGRGAAGGGGTGRGACAIATRGMPQSSAVRYRTERMWPLGRTNRRPLATVALGTAILAACGWHTGPPPGGGTALVNGASVEPGARLALARGAAGSGATVELLGVDVVP